MQVTGALRNLAVAPKHASAFLTATCLAALKAALCVLGGQQEVVLNIGRVLSKLSLNEQCQVCVFVCVNVCVCVCLHVCVWQQEVVPNIGRMLSKLSLNEQCQVCVFVCVNVFVRVCLHVCVCVCVAAGGCA